MSIIGPIQSMLAYEDKKKKQEIRDLVRNEVARKYNTPAGANGKMTKSSSISMDNESICIVGRK